jgi:L-Ala-D/L-Glu epimerase
MRLSIHGTDWEYRTPFRIAYRTITHSRTLTVELREGELVGRGEAYGVPYRGETVEAMWEQLVNVTRDVEQGVTRADLGTLLPAGGARNALDCALWDLEAKRSGHRVWELAGLNGVHSLVTSYTLSLDAPEAMARAAAAVVQHPLLKLKLAGDGDLERVALVRAARPDAQLMVDVNQAWSEQQLHDWVPHLARLGVSLIEQPLPADHDHELAGYSGPIALCADESCQTVESLPALCGKYRYLNIKLDKTGGLTAALHLARRAADQGFKLMVGCMGGSSLSMAPGFVVGQFCEVADLDSPLLIKSDVPHGICYHGGRMQPPQPELWG